MKPKITSYWSFSFLASHFFSRIKTTRLLDVWFIIISNNLCRILNLYCFWLHSSCKYWSEDGLNLDQWSLNELGLKSKLNCEPSDQQSSEDDAQSAVQLQALDFFLALTWIQFRTEECLTASLATCIHMCDYAAWCMCDYVTWVHHVWPAPTLSEF